MRNEPLSPEARFFPELIRGLGYPLRGFSLIREHRLWGLSAVCIAVNVVLLVALLVLTFSVVMPQLDALSAAMVGASEQAWLQSLLKGAAFLVSFLAIVLVLAANAMVLLLVGQAVASPFLDMLSERVENLTLGNAPHPLTVARVLRAIMVALSDVVWSVLFLIAINLPILLIGWVPLVGQVLASVLSIGSSALLFSQEFIGLSMTRYFVGYRQRFAEVWRNRGLCLGFGLATMLLFVIPGLNLVLLPMAAVGGTLAYCDLRRAGRLAAPPFAASAVPARR